MTVENWKRLPEMRGKEFLLHVKYSNQSSLSYTYSDPLLGA